MRVKLGNAFSARNAWTSGVLEGGVLYHYYF